VKQLHAEDLFLSFACLRRDPVAMLELERALVRRIPQFVAKLGLSPSMIDEIKQEVLVKLLMSEDDAPPRLAQYKGSGSLDSWVCAVSIHAALARHRQAAREQVDLCNDLEQVLWEADESLSLASRQLAGLVNQALGDVLVSLSRGERVLLRMHYVEHLTLRQIGRIYAVNATTVMRRIDAITERIKKDVTTVLNERIPMFSTDLESVGRVLEAQVTVSIARILAS
jgi:RNA polymerase sigma-70 factor (ECF subfamily)